MGLKTLVKQNALFISMAFGALVYESFAHISFLRDSGEILGPYLKDWLPIGLYHVCGILLFSWCVQVFLLLWYC